MDSSHALLPGLIPRSKMCLPPLMGRKPLLTPASLSAWANSTALLKGAMDMVTTRVRAIGNISGEDVALMVDVVKRSLEKGVAEAGQTLQVLLRVLPSLVTDPGKLQEALGHLATDVLGEVANASRVELVV